MLFPNLVDVPLYRCVEDKNIIFSYTKKCRIVYHEILVFNQTACQMLEKLVIIVSGQTHRYEAYRLPYA